MYSSKIVEEARAPISVSFRSPSGATGSVGGFLHLWAIYIRGFNQVHHCQKALRGMLSGRVTTVGTIPDKDLTFDETANFDSLYICGVARGPVVSRKCNNLHVPLEPSIGSSLTLNTYNGYVLAVNNAKVLTIPELPDGWEGLPRSYTRCCNFRFCVGRFGYRSRTTCATSSGAVKFVLKMPPNRHAPPAVGY
jgi:hypothetical protein